MCFFLHWRALEVNSSTKTKKTLSTPISTFQKCIGDVCQDALKCMATHKEHMLTHLSNATK